MPGDPPRCDFLSQRAMVDRGPCAAPKRPAPPAVATPGAWPRQRHACAASRVVDQDAFARVVAVEGAGQVAQVEGDVVRRVVPPRWSAPRGICASSSISAACAGGVSGVSRPPCSVRVAALLDKRGSPSRCARGRTARKTGLSLFALGARSTSNTVLGVGLRLEHEEAHRVACWSSRPGRAASRSCPARLEIFTSSPPFIPAPWCAAHSQGSRRDASAGRLDAGAHARDGAVVVAAPGC